MTSSVQIATAARGCCDTLHEWLPTQAGNAHRVEARLGLGWERPTCKLIRSTGMRAFAVESFGEPGSVHDLPKPEPTEGQVRVRVAAASVNPIDNFVIKGF